ncbi:hypothetical protein ARMGADRAFT_93925 [Armillaria gallica]|uniref:Uncharacterized protein n=1 Tax=Armillaria gallica TaxID=47427 RepID=A0A2H3CAK8_ARMGA|nr:hypothetical protein ARMGADRAFT_93925 [Armillaria gallica]
MRDGHWHVLGSACEVTGLHNRRGSRFWYHALLQAHSQRSRSTLWRPSTLFHAPQARRSPTITGRLLHGHPLLQIQLRLFSSTPGNVAAVSTAAGALGDAMRTTSTVAKLVIWSPSPRISSFSPISPTTATTDLLDTRYSFARSARSEHPRLGLIPWSRVRNDGETGEEGEQASTIAVLHPCMDGRCRA